MIWLLRSILIFAFGLGGLACISGQAKHADVLQYSKTLFFKKKEKTKALDSLSTYWSQVDKTTLDSIDMEVGLYLAYLHYRNKAYDSSIDHYHRIMQLENSEAFHPRCYKYINLCLNKKQNHELAITMAKQGYNHPATNCRWKHNLAHDIARSMIYSGSSDVVDEAIAWLDTSFYYYKKCGAGNPKVLANRHMDQGILYKRKDDFNSAIASYTSAEKLLKKCCPASKKRFKINNNIGSLYYKADNYDQAHQYFSEAMSMLKKQDFTIEKEQVSPLYRNLIKVSRKAKDYGTAKRWLTENEAYLSDAAQENGDSTLVVLNLALNHIAAAELYFELHNNSQETAPLDTAYDYIREAFKEYFTLREYLILDRDKISKTNQLRGLFELYIEVALAKGEVAKAMQVMEQAKYLNLLDHFDATDYEGAGHEAMARLELDAVDIGEIMRLDKGGPRSSNRDWSEWEGDMPLMAFYRMREAYVRLVAGPGGMQYSLIEDADEVDAMIQQFRQGIMAREAVDSLAHTLHDRLIGGSGDGLIGVVISPHGKLEGLPFAALMRAGRYWVEETAITYIKSRYIPYREWPTERQVCLLPSYSGSADLPHARREVAILDTLYHFEKIDQDKATATHLAAMAASHHVLHISSHCHTDTEDFEKSYISLSNGEKWSVRDILSAGFQANLLVLSACATGEGEQDMSEGTRGVSYAFHILGSHNQLTTLWEVDDEATSQIFTAFYQHLREATVAQSLRAGQLDYIASSMAALRHPYFWAGIRFEGEPGRRITLHRAAGAASNPFCGSPSVLWVLVLGIALVWGIRKISAYASQS